MPRHLLLGFTLIFAGSMTVAAQPKQSTPAPAKVSTNEAPVETEAERLLRERRANAQSLLISLATDARNFTDATVRARAQARIADMLWEADRERSRTMFRAAWDAAEVADAEIQQRVREDIRQQQARTGKGGFVIASPPNLRREVLEFAARHDSKLGEELLARYKDQKAREAADERNHRTNPFGTDDATGQRFGAAKQLVEAGDIKRALEFADPALGSVNMDSVDFLSQLREKDPAAADQRYAAMILNAPLNPQADANTVSLLSSYLFSPHQYAVFMANGSSTSRMGGGTAPTNVSSELRAAFFRMASVILLRPLGDQSTAGPDGQYLGLSDPDRPRAFFGVTNALFLIDHKSAWQQIDDAIRAANSADSFSGEDGELVFGVRVKGMHFGRSNPVPDFDIGGIFGAFATEDYERAVELARGLQRESPRAIATIAVARSVLDQKKN